MHPILLHPILPAAAPATRAVMPVDSGPMYAETRMDRFPVEPWNTFSNFIFLFILIYWARRTRLRLSAFPVTVFSLPVLALGFVSGTLYHAYRDNDLWRILDAGPIVFLVLLAAVYLWRSVLGSLLGAAAVVVLPALVYRIATATLAMSHQFTISLGYAFLGFVIVVPAILHCRKGKWAGLGSLVAAVVLFGAALVFRQIDLLAFKNGLPMGTHFLWHVLGGSATFFVLQYIFRSESVLSSSP